MAARADRERSGIRRDPEDRITLDESVSMALLAVLESLTPAGRAAFLLHDVSGYRQDRRCQRHPRD
jgi:hypothetical protein